MANDNKLLRYTVGALHSLIAVNALAGGYYAMAGAKNVPLEWLRGSPFQDYFWPGLILFVVVGIFTGLAGLAVFTRHRFGRPMALWAATIVLVWIIAQLGIIGYVSWLQPAVFIAGLLLLMLGWLLPNEEELARGRVQH